MNIVIIGTGYVGLVTGVGLASLNNNVTFIDLDSDKITNLSNKSLPFYEPDLENYFTDKDVYSLFLEAKNLNIPVKIHADEFVDTGATSLAVEMGAISADHLMVTGNKGKNDLANSNTLEISALHTSLAVPGMPCEPTIMQANVNKEK